VSRLDALVERGRLVVLVGPGGVGKTTLAAALAVRAAMLGRHAFVLTIDPARRLASALGIAGEAAHGRHVRVPLDALRAPGVLTAAMLDPRASYDALIARIASDESRQAILDNRVYRAFSRTLARSHAYVAMEHLYDVLEGPSPPDLVVLDTPPLRSALDVLDAPLALARFAEHRVAVALAGGALGSAGAYAAGRLVGLLAGEALGEELSTFLRAFLGMRAGFAERARRIDRILRDEARFVLAMAPDATHVADARHLVVGLEERGIPMAATLGNRAFTEDPRRPLAPMPTVDAAPGDPLAQRALARARELAARDAERRALVASFPGARFVFPRAHAEPLDVTALHALALAGRPL
jgi:anion-transporting  ArsA/GET3 family ATPase